VTIRAAELSEVGALARLWHRGWQDAHEAILPVELVRDRTLDRFARRLESVIDEVRVVGPLGAPRGFYILKVDELHQFYVAAEARGSGLASALIADAEALLARRGVARAKLDCAIGNARAAKFYEKSAWQRIGTMVSRLETDAGPFELEIWRYEKDLLPGTSFGVPRVRDV
jgi:GNAT superfamily N-acetyltransferase